ncbi:MAG: HRDC domain-containing protein [Clostridia bacterium]|nr:HRDC domain-containing protein [Clostridia bacterium]
MVFPDAALPSMATSTRESLDAISRISGISRTKRRSMTRYAGA